MVRLQTNDEDADRKQINNLNETNSILEIYVYTNYFDRYNYYGGFSE